MTSTTIIGNFFGNNGKGQLNWVCPITGEQQYAMGQFDMDNDGLVYYEYRKPFSDKIEYIVKQA
jgi:hypothetical protein